MQTFLPYPSFSMSAEVIDKRRLGKQRVETLQIMRALTNPEYGWQNHPAVNMWRGYEHSLMEYQYAICNYWTMHYGFKDTCLDKTKDIFYSHAEFFDNGSEIPDWIGDWDFHAGHRSNLLRKDPEHYRRFWPDEPEDLPYIWPTKKVEA